MGELAAAARDLSCPPGRSDILAMLAQQDGQGPADDGRIDSLQLAWLLYQVEQRYQVELDLDDDQLALMDSVSRAVDVLAAALGAGGAHGSTMTGGATASPATAGGDD